MPDLHIGCSGFNYTHWKNIFYPDGLPQKRWLEHYQKVFSTVELNVTFYRLPLASSFERRLLISFLQSKAAGILPI